MTGGGGSGKYQEEVHGGRPDIRKTACETAVKKIDLGGMFRHSLGQACVGLVITCIKRKEKENMCIKRAGLFIYPYVVRMRYI
jgi:hypothetical protein